MQNPTTPAQTGLRTVKMLMAFSGFIVFQNPLKYMWITGLLGAAMLYFSVKRYKEEKASGVNTRKSKDVIQLSAVATILIFIVFTGYHLMEMGVFGDL